MATMQNSHENARLRLRPTLSDTKPTTTFDAIAAVVPGLKRNAVRRRVAEAHEPRGNPGVHAVYTELTDEVRSQIAHVATMNLLENRTAGPLFAGLGGTMSRLGS